LRALGYDTGEGVSPIVPVILGDRERTFRLWKTLFEEGVFTNPVTAPAVPPGKDLIRTSYMATHTDVHLDAVFRGFERAGKRLRLLDGDGEAAIVRPRRAQRARR
jgi:7-keto-8-aminopelargonate synthetase-like enzyme